jgi:hypothetical protein
MKLSDLRKLSVKRQARIRFEISNGLECIITEVGIVEFPKLSAPPDFKLEEELERVETFVVEPIAVSDRKAEKPARLSRQELETVLGGLVGGASVAHDHDE